MELKDKTVIVTGAGTGIGRALALEFARQGAKVVCCGRRVQKINETATLIEQEGGTPLSFPTDITQRSQVERMVNETLKRFGEIDVLFNNAGSFQTIGGVWEVAPDLWWHDVTVNLLGAFLCIRAVLPHMMARNGGVIINMDGGRPTGGTAYACGKAGLMELTRILVQELKREGKNVMVFSAGPGLVQTEMTELQVKTEAGRKWIPSTKEIFDAGKTRSPEEIARATIEMLRIARPGLSGASYNPDTDFTALASRGSIDK